MIADDGTHSPRTPSHAEPLYVALACGAGDDPHRRHRRSQPKDVVWIGGHHYRAAMHRRHGDRMRINDVLCIRARTVKDGPNTTSEVKICRNDSDRGPRGARLAMPRQRCLDSTGTAGAPAALSTHHSRNQHVTLALPGLGQQRPQAVGRGPLCQRVQAVSIQDERCAGHPAAALGLSSASSNAAAASARTSGGTGPAWASHRSRSCRSVASRPRRSTCWASAALTTADSFSSPNACASSTSSSSTVTVILRFAISLYYPDPGHMAAVRAGAGLDDAGVRFLARLTVRSPCAGCTCAAGHHPHPAGPAQCAPGPGRVPPAQRPGAAGGGGGRLLHVRCGQRRRSQGPQCLCG